MLKSAHRHNDHIMVKRCYNRTKFAQKYLHKYMIIIKFAVCFSWY